MMDTGAIFDGRTIKHGVLVIGVHTAAIIAISVNAFGAFVVGINAVGVVAIGTNAVGIIAIGVNAVGIIAIGTNAVGVITITLGGYGYGIYVLSIRKGSEAKTFSHRIAKIPKRLLSLPGGFRDSLNRHL